MMESLVALLALSLMEIVLGIDNIVFISILTSKLPLSQQSLGRRLGLALALIMRLVLLGCIFWLAQLVTPVFYLSDYVPLVGQLKSRFTVAEPHGKSGHFGHSITAEKQNESSHESDSTDAAVSKDIEPQIDLHAWEEFNGVSWRDLILIAGGIFLIFNSVREIHAEVEGLHEGHGADGSRPKTSFYGLLTKIAIMDIIFSLDSVITAVGMADELWIMMAAVIIAVGVMIAFANQVGNFVDRNPTIKMLALNFLLLIGVMLVAEGIGTPINKGYIYFAMAFSLLVEFFNMRRRTTNYEPPLPVA